MTPEELRELREIELGILRKMEYAAASCAGKFGFDTHSDAKKSIHGKMGTIEPYRCGRCGKWHVGSNIEARRKIKARRNIYRMRRRA